KASSLRWHGRPAGKAMTGGKFNPNICPILGSIMGRIIQQFLFIFHYISAFCQDTHYTCTNKRYETYIPHTLEFESQGRDMAKRTRQSKRKRNASHPERFLLGLRKKLGVKTLLEVKQNALQKALVATKGDKALAAALLGIGKTTLYRRLAD